jgi:hypothetical protein
MRTVVSLAAVAARDDEEEDEEEEEEPPPRVRNPRKDKMHNSRFLNQNRRQREIKKNKRKTKVRNFFPYLGRNRFTRDRVR